MKLTITVLLLFLAQASFGQFSISVGSSRQVDNFFENRGYNGFLWSRLNHYDVRKLQLDYQRPKFRVYTELGYFRENVILDMSSSSTLDEGSYTTFYDYYAETNFSYLSWKIGAGKQWSTKVKNDKRFAFSLNGFVQLDRKLHENEWGHTTKHIGATSSPGGPTSITVFPTSFERFDALQLQDNVGHVGGEIKGRLYWKSYFLELSMSLAIADKQRQQLSASSNYISVVNQRSLWMYHLGLKLGWELPRLKKSEQSNLSN